MAPNNRESVQAGAHTSDLASKSSTVVDHFIREFEVIQSRYEEPGLDRFDTEGKPIVRRTIQYFVDNHLPITIVLPAFPFKSPNTESKVLGTLPDRGEELALQRLEDFCVAIESVHPLGCSVVIFSDGRVFNDLLGVPAKDLNAYKVELKAMVEDAGHTHIHFDGLENHTSNTDNPIQEVLERFHVEDMSRLIKEDAGLLNTYRSFRIFLRHDLAPRWVGKSKNSVGNKCGAIAKKMMHRNVGFSKLVDKVYPHAFRMSIHLYNNAGPKFGVHLVPHSTGVPRTPWHSVICEDLDGSIHARARREVSENKYELVEKRGRAWGFRERAQEETAESFAVEQTATSSVASVDHKEEWKALNVDFFEQPLCLVIRARETDTDKLPSVMDIPVESYRSLIQHHGVVSLQGFKQDDDLEAASERMGEILEWPFGKTFEIKVLQGTTMPGQTQERMPMHYDGMYKKKSAGATELGDVPLLQLFHCVEAYPSAERDDAQNGCTLFAHSRPIIQSLTTEEIERLRSITLVYTTTMFGNKTLVHTSPVIIPHPVTGEDVLRFHEPWGLDKTKLHATSVRSLSFVKSEVGDVDCNWVCDLLLPKLYDPQFCYTHRWVKGEFIISDNISLLHSRTAMKAGGRHVRRVHIN